MGIKHNYYSLFGEYLHPDASGYPMADVLVLDKYSGLWTVFYIDDRGGSWDTSYIDMHGNEIRKKNFDTEEMACEYFYEYIKSNIRGYLPWKNI